MYELLKWRIENVDFIIKFQAATLKNIINAQFADVKLYACDYFFSYR